MRLNKRSPVHFHLPAIHDEPILRLDVPYHEHYRLKTDEASSSIGIPARRSNSSRNVSRDFHRLRIFLVRMRAVFEAVSSLRVGCPRLSAKARYCFRHLRRSSRRRIAPSSAFVIRCNDINLERRFQKILEVGIKRVILPARSQNLNAFAERWIQLIKQDCLSKLILFGEDSLRRAVNEYILHYHEERNQQGIGNR